MIEAELKARVADPDALHAALVDRAAEPERATYSDVYLDRAGELEAECRELRVRAVDTSTGRRVILTYKGAAVDEVTGSKPEHETEVADRDAALAILEGLGYGRTIEFTKECSNYRWSTDGRSVLATVVTVPELDGTFIEIETMADESELSAALDDLRALLAGRGIPADALTTELYTDAVAAARSAW